MRYKSPFFQPFTAGLYSELDRWQGTSCMYFAIPSFSNSFAAFRAESWVPIGAPMLLYHFVREKSWVKVMIFGKITIVTSLYKNHQGIKVVFLKKTYLVSWSLDSSYNQVLVTSVYQTKPFQKDNPSLRNRSGYLQSIPMHFRQCLVFCNCTNQDHKD